MGTALLPAAAGALPAAATPFYRVTPTAVGGEAIETTPTATGCAFSP